VLGSAADSKLGFVKKLESVIEKSSNIKNNSPIDI